MKKVLALLAVILLTTSNLYAGNGDLIVNGNLGVGTTTPGNKLDVNGGINAQAFNSDNGNFIVGPVGGSARIWTRNTSPLAFLVNDGEVMRITDGNVGIGTVSPGAKLEIVPTTNSEAIRSISGYSLTGSDNHAIINLGGSWNTTGAPTLIDVNVTDYGSNAASALMNLKLDGISRFFVRKDGNVGIGTVNPQYDLHVDGSSFTTHGYWEQSDIKFKKDILPIDSALDKIVKLSGVSFEWIQDKKDKEDELIDSSKTDDNGSKKDEKDKIRPEDGRHYGVIAQEIEKVLPEIVKEDNEGNKAVAYMEIIPVLIEAMKEQQKQIMAQQKEIEQLKDTVAKSR